MIFAASTSTYDPDLTLAGMYEQYEACRRLGPATQTPRNYRLAWTGLVTWLRSDLGREPVAADFTTQSLTRYLQAASAERGWSEQSRKSYAGNIRSVASGCADLGYLRSDALAGFKLPKVTDRPVIFFSEPTLGRIFDALEAHRTPRNLRFAAMANIELDCGARPKEICEIRFVDLDEPGSRIRLAHGKGAKERTVPVGVKTWEYLRAYMRSRPRPMRPDEPVFVDLRKGVRPVDPGTLADDARDVLIEVGLVDPAALVAGEDDAGYSFYTFRKTFAKRSAKTMDVDKLAAIMGHSMNSIPMLTRIYYQPSIEETQPAHEVARPADSLHEWRASVDRPEAPDEPLSFFDEFKALARNTAGGSSPSSDPSSRKRTNGAYRSTSRSTSQPATGA